MSDGALSPDQIDQLLAGVDAMSAVTNKANEVLSQEEINQLLTAINADDSNEDFDETLDIFEKFLTANTASEQVQIKAWNLFGVIYSNGVRYDREKANYWFAKAAEQGDADAQYNIAIMHADGQGVPKDEAKAAEWYKKAAAQGHAKAKERLAKTKITTEATIEAFKKLSEMAKKYRLKEEMGEGIDGKQNGS